MRARVFLIAVFLVAALWLWNPGDLVTGAASAARDFLTRGPRLSTSTLSAGTAAPSAEELRAQAEMAVGQPVDLDAYALARMIRSEADQKLAATAPVSRLLRAHVAWNDAQQHGWSLFETVTHGRGTFGEQAGRRYSTARDPYQNDLEIAESVIESRAAGGPDPTSGATKFVNTRGGFSVPQSWLDEGFEAVEIVADNVESDLVFLREAV